jgi:phosphatidylglycerol---prolipoprotein diacylglyceryl transferase
VPAAHDSASRYPPPVINITPSPVAFSLGPITVPWYGMGYVAALAVGSYIATREARRRGEDPEHVWNAVLFVFVLGIVGARLYHVIDQWGTLYARDPIRVILPPYTGLAVYGGIVGGLIAVVLYTRRHGLRTWQWADIAVPALFFGQAIGRWGNFFNQELYGPPTSLPWGIAIQCQYRVAAYPCSTYPFATTGFHPLFFYESALSLIGGIVALLVARRFAARLRDGDLVAFWLVWYGAARSLLEPLRDGYNWTFFGIPVAILVGLGAIGGGIVWAWWLHHRPAPAEDDAFDDDRDEGDRDEEDSDPDPGGDPPDGEPPDDPRAAAPQPD